ncbi:hypothetical protein V7S43_002404 [Phytophthora oleae]|uniref:Uncharacterized protein n=1 Tax=Phytophthora oleae TaxID=2107226 RepID=A0ABD3G3Q6_9STRA
MVAEETKDSEGAFGRLASMEEECEHKASEDLYGLSTADATAWTETQGTVDMAGVLESGDEINPRGFDESDGTEVRDWRM